MRFRLAKLTDMSPEREPNFLTREEVDALRYEAIERYGGHHGVLNERLVESVIDQPRQTYHVGGGDLSEIAAYAYHIAAGHPYWDGDKRTGGAAAITFLERNGVETSRACGLNARYLPPLWCSMCSMEEQGGENGWCDAHFYAT